MSGEREDDESDVDCFDDGTGFDIDGRELRGWNDKYYVGI